MLAAIKKRPSVWDFQWVLFSTDILKYLGESWTPWTLCSETDVIYNISVVSKDITECSLL